MIKSIFNTILKRVDDRRRYQALLAEIEMLNERDLIDMGADRGDMQRGAWKQIYG